MSGNRPGGYQPEHFSSILEHRMEFTCVYGHSSWLFDRNYEMVTDV